MDVSALVVTWNSGADIASCLDAVLAQEGVELEVVVVDNGSRDATREILQGYEADPRVTVLPQEQNLGYAGGNNLAARHARGRHLLLLNPDCAVAPDCVRLLTESLDRTPGLGAGAAVLQYPDGTSQSFLRRDVTFRIGLWAFLETARRIDARLLHGRHDAYRCYREFDGVTPDELLDVDCPAAACVLVPRALIGDRLFDPQFPLFFNDAELYRRLRATGYRVALVPGAWAVHRYGASVAEVPSARRRAETVATLRRYVSSDWSIPATPLLWLLLVADALVGLIPTRTRETARGTLGGLGLPGGAKPWLSTVPPARVRTRLVAQRLKGVPLRILQNISRHWRRSVFMQKARWGARLSRCKLDLDVARTADLPRRVRFELAPGSRARLRIGERALVRPDLVLRLSGDLEVGPLCELRQGVVLNVKGRLLLVGRNVLGRGAMVHADNDQVWEWGATTGEYVTVLDSEHVVSGGLVHPFDQPVRHRPVLVGACSLLGAQVVVLPGVRIGRAAVIGAGSVVTKDVPDGATARGVPARSTGNTTRFLADALPGPD